MARVKRPARSFMKRPKKKRFPTSNQTHSPAPAKQRSFPSADDDWDNRTRRQQTAVGSDFGDSAEGARSSRSPLSEIDGIPLVDGQSIGPSVTSSQERDAVQTIERSPEPMKELEDEAAAAAVALESENEGDVRQDEEETELEDWEDSRDKDFRPERCAERTATHGMTLRERRIHRGHISPLTSGKKPLYHI